MGDALERLRDAWAEASLEECSIFLGELYDAGTATVLLRHQPSPTQADLRDAHGAPPPRFLAVSDGLMLVGLNWCECGDGSRGPPGGLCRRCGQEIPEREGGTHDGDQG